MSITDRFVNSSHGRIHIKEAGEGRPILLLHTLGGSSFQFVDTLQLLARNYRAIAWDMPGQGDSSPLTGHLSIENYGDAVIDVLNELEIDKAYLFGQSIGGYITADVAARWGQRIHKAFVGEAPPRILQDYIDGWYVNEQALTKLTNSMNEIESRFRSPTPDLLVRWNIDRNKAGAKCLMDAYWVIREFDYMGTLKKIDIPALIVLGL